MNNPHLLLLRNDDCVGVDLEKSTFIIENFLLEGISTSIEDAKLYIDKLHIDILLMLVDKPDSKKINFIEELKLSNKVKVIGIYSKESAKYILEIYRMSGADRVGGTNVSIDNFLGILKTTFEQYSETPRYSLPSDKVLDERISNIFISSGITPHIKGYQFLREGVKLAVRNPSLINQITKILYPAIAIKFDTSSSKVERAIRHAIDVAWARGKIDNINNLYGVKVFSKEEKPTNGELIALISDKLIIEGAC